MGNMNVAFAPPANVLSAERAPLIQQQQHQHQHHQYVGAPDDVESFEHGLVCCGSRAGRVLVMLGFVCMFLWFIVLCVFFGTRTERVV